MSNVVENNIDQEIAQALTMSETELLESLGTSALGTESLNDAVTARTILFSVADESNTESARGFLSSSLIERGRAFFARLWSEIKGIVCHIYKEGIKVEKDADIVKDLVGVVVAAGQITNALAVLVLTIAVKRGLNLLCPASE